MVALTSHSSPSSLQLRLGLKIGKPSPVLFRIRFPASHGRWRRVRLVAAAATGSPASEGGEGRGQWTSSNGSSDSFSAWSSEESDGGSPHRGRFGGIMGVGLAGLFFAGGITFASLSLSSRNTGIKQQMEPLTAQQEVLLVSDDQNEKIDPVGYDSGAVVSDKGSLPTYTSSSNTGISKESVSSIEITESTFESRVGDIVHVESSSTQNTESIGTGVDTIHKGSSLEDLCISTVVDHPAAPTGINLSSTAMPDYNVVDSSLDAFSFKGSFNLASGTSDSVIGLVENMGTDNLLELSSVTDITNLNTDHQEKIFFSNETEISKLPLVSGGSSGEPLTFDSSTTAEPNASLAFPFDSEDVVEKVDSVSREQDSELTEKLPLPTEAATSPPVVHNIKENVSSGINSASNIDQSETLQLPGEVINFPLEVHKLDVNGPFEAPASVPVGTYENEPDTNGHNETNRSRSLFESVLPENSFSYAGIPAPSVVSAALQAPPGKVLVPALVDQVQGQALSALQVLKVIEVDVQPGDLCTRREYARWLLSASILSRNTISKVYPAMYIENVTDLAFDDVSPEDLDFPFIQGLAEAGLISSKLSRSDVDVLPGGEQDPVLFSPESPISRQDLVSWKMALEKRHLPEVDRKILYQCSGFIDIDKINPDAWPALVGDLSTGEHGIISLAFGYTRLFQPDKPVTKGQAAIALANGDAAEVVGEELTHIEVESLADTDVAAQTALVTQVEKDLNAAFEKELTMERGKIDALEKLAEEARLELEKLRKEREEENNALITGRAAVESEMEVFSRLRNEVEEQLQSLVNNKMGIAFERERINKLRKEAESENQVIVRLQYELEVERKALSMARAWAEDEAKRAREQAKVLEEAREQWERHGLKVIVDGDLRDDAIAGTTWLNAGKQSPVDETTNRAENLVDKLKAMAVEIKGKSAAVIEKIIQTIISLISVLKQRAFEVSQGAVELQSVVLAKSGESIQEFQENASGFGSSIREGAKRVVEDCRESVEKITHKFKT